MPYVIVGKENSGEIALYYKAVRAMSQVLCLALMLLTCRALPAQNWKRIEFGTLFWFTVPGQMVLAGRGFMTFLLRMAFNVSIVQEPETSLQEDVAAIKRILAQQTGPCILVAHSYGGAVITEASKDSSVASLVYIAAHMPDAGENEADSW